MLGHKNADKDCPHRVLACIGCGKISAHCPCFEFSNAEVEHWGWCGDCYMKGPNGHEGPCSNPECYKSGTTCPGCGRAWELVVVGRNK